jgi:hypothetical protein
LGDRVCDRRIGDGYASFEEHSSLAQSLDHSEVVRYEDDGSSLLRNLAHLSKRFALEGGVSYGQDLVDQKNLGLEMSGDGEGQSDRHAARVTLDGCVEESLELGEVDDLVESSLDLGAPHPEDRAVQVDVLPSRQLRMKARPHLEQRADAAGDLGPPGRRFGDAGQDLQQRALAGAVVANQPDHVAVANFERHVAQCPQRVGFAAWFAPP